MQEHAIWVVNSERKDTILQISIRQDQHNVDVFILKENICVIVALIMILYGGAAALVLVQRT